MEFYKKIYFKLRPLILPIDKILEYIPPRASILDIGCGKGLLTKHIKNFEYYTGVDLAANPREAGNNIKFVKDDCLTYLNNDLSNYNTFLVIDLIHHIPVKQQLIFLKTLINSLKSGDILIIKDINPRNLILKFWNSFHDFVMSRQIIRYLDFNKFEKNIEDKIKILDHFHSRILLYDHYFLVLKKS